MLAWAIHDGTVPESKRFTLDYGVSYALAGVIAVLTYWWPRGWMRWVYAAGVLVFYGQAMLRGRTFTDVGHFTATLVGLGCYPIARGRVSPMARGWRWRGLVAPPPVPLVARGGGGVAAVRAGAVGPQAGRPRMPVLQVLDGVVGGAARRRRTSWTGSTSWTRSAIADSSLEECDGRGGGGAAGAAVRRSVVGARRAGGGRVGAVAGPGRRGRRGGRRRTRRGASRWASRCALRRLPGAAQHDRGGARHEEHGGGHRADESPAPRAAGAAGGGGGLVEVVASSVTSRADLAPSARGRAPAAPRAPLPDAAPTSAAATAAPAGISSSIRVASDSRVLSRSGLSTCV